jgi:hypothetical protein
MDDYRNLELRKLDKLSSKIFIDSNKLLHKFSESTNDQEREFVGMPLQM